MGRPPLNMKPTNIRLPQETMDRIDAIVDRNRRAVFIREAVEHALRLAEMIARRLPPVE